MAYDYRYTQKRTTTTGNRPGRRSFYPPPPPPSGSSHHGVFTYWLPLIVTGTLAIGGLAAWIWSERDHDEDDYPHDKPPRPPGGAGPQPYPLQGSQSYPGRPPPQSQQQPPPPQQQGPRPPPPPGGEASSYYDQSQTYRASTEQTSVENRDVQQSQDGNTWYGRVTGFMKRTPSPQQFFDGASKQVSAGMSALGSIMEGGGEGVGYDERSGTGNERNTRPRRRRDEQIRASEKEEGFSDHERWSEEAEEQEQEHRISFVEAESERRADRARDERPKGNAKRTVAVVVSADMDAEDAGEHDAAYRTEHASLLSHLPQNTAGTTDLFVLIYSPGLKTLPPVDYQPSAAPNTASRNSSPAVNTPGSELQSISPRPSSPSSQPFTGASAYFNALYAQSLTLVSSPTQILPFTTPDGYVHILRHLAPGLVYVSDLLSGHEGSAVEKLKGWVGHTVVVAGDEGFGGLVDTETETENEGDAKGGRDARGQRRKNEKWYERSQIVGLGKDVEVVDVGRVGEDWGRRVGA